MGWQSDWLYQLIFKNIQQHWEQALMDGKLIGPAPDYCIVSQFADLKSVPYQDSYLMATSKGPVIKRWRLDRTGIHRITEADEKQLTIPYEGRGAFYRIGKISFCISCDRKIVAIKCNFGPRYGTSRVYKVQGQGKNSQLLGHEDFVWSIY